MKTDNELIAEFMGFEFKNDHTNVKYWHYNELNLVSTDLIFNESWDWLMPVVEKMYSLWLGVGEDGFQKSLNLRLHSFSRKCPIHSPITQVYLRVVEFIKWYNKNSSNSEVNSTPSQNEGV